VVHQPVSRGFAVFADAWLSGWLAETSADLRENGSALEVVLHDYALYKSTFTLLYFPRSSEVNFTKNYTLRYLHLYVVFLTDGRSRPGPSLLVEGSLGYRPQKGRRSVRDRYVPSCNISRRSVTIYLQQDREKPSNE